MKSILLSFLILFSVKSNAQFYLGLTEAELIKQIPNQEHITVNAISKKYNKDGTYYLTWSSDAVKSTSLIFFDDKGISNGLVMLPYNTETFNSWVESFNKRFVSVSSMEWKYYTEGKVYSIVAVYHSEEKNYSVLFMKKE